MTLQQYMMYIKEVIEKMIGAEGLFLLMLIVIAIICTIAECWK